MQIVNKKMECTQDVITHSQFEQTTKFSREEKSKKTEHIYNEEVVAEQSLGLKMGILHVKEDIYSKEFWSPSFSSNSYRPCREHDVQYRRL